MFARFDENPAMTLQDIKKKKRYGRTDGCKDSGKTVYPSQTKFAGGIIGRLQKSMKNFTEAGKNGEDPEISSMIIHSEDYKGINNGLPLKEGYRG